MKGNAGKRYRRLLAGLAAVICIAAAVAVSRIAGCGPAQDELDTTAPAGHVWREDLPLARVVLLFFPEPHGARLSAEPRRLIARGGTAGLMKAALLELGRGPLDRTHVSPFGGELKVRGVYLSIDGTVYVDLESGAGDTFGRGLSEEVAAVQAIASTIFFNFPQAGRLKLLVDGEPAGSVAGHVDLTGFLYPEDWLETSGLELQID